MTQHYNEFVLNLFKKMKDPNSINLAVGQPDFRPPEEMLKVLKENVHYVKPTPRKLLFKSKAIEKWLHRNKTIKPNAKGGFKSFINI